MNLSTRSNHRILVALAIIWAMYGINSVSQAAQPLNILFIGNSHTSMNDMPGMFKAIAINAGAVRPHVSSSTIGGYYLSQHLTNASTLAAISNGYGATHLQWDYVVLQEHSDLPSYAESFEYCRDWFQSAATGLYDKVKASNPNAKVVIFETSAWHQSYFDGYYEPGFALSATDMQYRVRKWCNDTAYTYIPAHSTAASKNDALVSPIGDAWERNYSDPNGILLHINSADDKYHPNYAGTYLGALVMYSTIYNAKPQGINYYGGLNSATANYLQQIATATMAVPEPGTLTTLSGGVGCLLLTRRKRSQLR